MAGKTWENPVHKLWLCDPKSLDALPHITPYLMGFPGFSTATLPMPSFAAFSLNSVMSGTPWAHPLLRRSVTELWTVARLLHGCCTVAARLLHGCCVAMPSGTPYPATEAGTVAVWHWTKSGARWGGWRETKKKPRGDGTSRIWITWYSFVFLLEIFRRNQLWDIVGIKFWMVEVYHETQDAWCCGRQRFNKNGAYPLSFMVTTSFYVTTMAFPHVLPHFWQLPGTSIYWPILNFRHVQLSRIMARCQSTSPTSRRTSNAGVTGNVHKSTQIGDEQKSADLWGMKLSLDLPHAFGEPFLIVFPHVSTGWCFVFGFPSPQQDIDAEYSYIRAFASQILNWSAWKIAVKAVEEYTTHALS